MQIMTQDCRRLINEDFVRMFYIEQDGDHVNLIASADEDILLGAYDKMEHAERVLAFIGHCIVDNEAQNKITQIPSRKEMEVCDKIHDDKGPRGSEPGGRSKVLMAQVLTFFLC